MLNDGFPSAPSPPKSIHARLGFTNPIHHERHLRVVCIGAGASGLLIAYKLQRSFSDFELVCYEKNPDLGGTWYENRYPGCACDVPAHTYTWSFEPNPSWSSVYAGSEEIYEYFKRFSEKYDLGKYCKFGHEVTCATWNPTSSKWEIIISNGSETIHDSCDVLFNAAGLLNNWKLPDIDGLRDYKGKLLHTASWDQNVDLIEKHVGLIGNGSSGIQVLPAISSQASKITTFIRHPTWVSPAQAQEQHIYSEDERRVFESDPEALLSYRKALETGFSGLWPVFIADSDTQKTTFDGMTTMMRDKLRNEKLEELVIPSWGVGCKRITPGVGYLEALASDKVEVAWGDIAKINERGPVGFDGMEYPVDVLICATGFDVSYRPRFPIIGTSGQSLGDVWADVPEAYFGIAAHGFPNYFMIGGPNSPVGNGPVLVALEAQADYALKMIDRLQTENIRSFEPKLEAVRDFSEHRDRYMTGTVWDIDCGSWYRRNGKVVATWTGSTLHYLEAIEQPRFDDWDFKYAGNRFAYFGNGFSQTELDPEADWAFYLRNKDDSPYMSRNKRRIATTHTNSSTQITQTTVKVL
ncbi:hypothetical protein HYPSUDRAFT_54285 [Hypholoma sublateritium FD-334 SS-4]|uniref:FAD/NAD(P)-binding domain-containing protein n=1 Tax=Hypholoma sublateritium (strain FD-334 SS-4) TaxID=945553 RepID=A0A0D2NXT5_HYPSF|nr:hypothetical protein HYPSUDRAFT_54285 [Hypholoma sublateritium FD-334 SS-4]